MPKISALTSLAQADVVTTTDVLPIVDATAPATTKKVTVQAMVNAGLATLTTLPSGIVNASLTSVGTLTALNVSGQSVFSGANAGLELGAKASANTPFIDFNSSGNSNDYDARIIASAGTTAGTGNLTVFLNSFNVSGALGVTGQSSFAAGSAAAPSVKVGGEQNGLFSSTANTLDVTVGGLRQARFQNVASAVNYWLISGSTAGGFSNILEAAGTDSNIQNLYASKGTSGHVFRTGGSGGFTQFLIGNTTNAVNYLSVVGSATTASPLFLAQGSDTNVTARYRTQGTGSHQFETGSSGNIALVLNHTATAVNYYAINGGATGVQPGFAATGSDVNVSSAFTTKGTGAHFFSTNTYGSLALAIVHTASAVNYAQITGAATGNAPAFSVAGSDSNIDFAITPKGTGNVRFGTHSAIAAETVTGYITIKDSAGNTRKLAVLS